MGKCCPEDTTVCRFMFMDGVMVVLPPIHALLSTKLVNVVLLPKNEKKQPSVTETMSPHRQQNILNIIDRFKDFFKKTAPYRRSGRELTEGPSHRWIFGLFGPQSLHSPQTSSTNKTNKGTDKDEDKTAKPI